jgi:hypothetical protein
MVKNTTGGSRAKSQARKMTRDTGASASGRVRTVTDPLEHYAIVTINYGQGRCAVRTAAGLELACVVRNKFCGRSRSSNNVAVDSIVMVGLRDWEAATGFRICDLLEVYSAEEAARLRAMPGAPLAALTPMAKHGAGGDDGGVVFSAVPEYTTDDFAPADDADLVAAPTGAAAASADESWFADI